MDRINRTHYQSEQIFQQKQKTHPVSYTHLDVYKRQFQVSEQMVVTWCQVWAIRLSLIHIQMCIRDRVDTVSVGQRMQTAYHLNITICLADCKLQSLAGTVACLLIVHCGHSRRLFSVILSLHFSYLFYFKTEIAQC